MKFKRILITAVIVALFTLGATGTAMAQDTATPTEENEIQPSEESQNLGELWNNFAVFTSLVVLVYASLGLWGKSLSVGAFLGYLAFAHIALETQADLFLQIVYVTATLILIGMAFKLWRLEFGGTGE